MTEQGKLERERYRCRMYRTVRGVETRARKQARLLLSRER